MPMSRHSGVLVVLQQMHEWFLLVGGRGLLLRTVTSLLPKASSPVSLSAACEWE